MYKILTYLRINRLTAHTLTRYDLKEKTSISFSFLSAQRVTRWPLILDKELAIIIIIIYTFEVSYFVGVNIVVIFAIFSLSLFEIYDTFLCYKLNYVFYTAQEVCDYARLVSNNKTTSQSSSSSSAVDGNLVTSTIIKRQQNRFIGGWI